MKNIRTRGILVVLSLLFCGVLNIASAAPPAHGREASAPRNRVILYAPETHGSVVALWRDLVVERVPDAHFEIVLFGEKRSGAGDGESGPVQRFAARSDGILISGVELPISREGDRALFRGGAKPVRFRVALDALVFYVHELNDIESLTTAEIAALFGDTPSRLTFDDGRARTLRRWGDLNMKGQWKRRSIHPYLAEYDLDALHLVRSQILDGGEFRSSLRRFPSATSVVQRIGADLGGIGFGSLARRTSGVQPIAISVTKESTGESRGGSRGRRDSTAVYPTERTLARGEYPFTYFLNIYVHHDALQVPDKERSHSGRAAHRPETTPDAQTIRSSEEGIRAFLAAALSAEGQDVARRDGYVALPEELLAAERKLFTRESDLPGSPIEAHETTRAGH